MTNEARASVQDRSGLLEATAITNDGAFTVAQGASLSVVPLQGVYGEPASFTNDGAARQRRGDNGRSNGGRHHLDPGRWFGQGS